MPIATVKQKRVWDYYTFCLDDRKAFVKANNNPADTEIEKIMAYVEARYNPKVRKNKMKPYVPSTWQRMVNQSAGARRENRCSKSRSRSPHIPRKQRVCFNK